MVASAGAFGQGEAIFITALLPDHMVIDAEGVNDVIAPYVAILDNFNGSGRFWAMVTPVRIRCRNTERLAVNNAVTQVGHPPHHQRADQGQRGAAHAGPGPQVLRGFSGRGKPAGADPDDHGPVPQAMAEAFGELAKADSASSRVWGSRLRDAEDAAQTTRTKLSNDRREESLMEWFDQVRGRAGRHRVRGRAGADRAHRPRHGAQGCRPRGRAQARSRRICKVRSRASAADRPMRCASRPGWPARHHPSCASRPARRAAWRPTWAATATT